MVTYIINLDQYKSIETPWIVFYVNEDNVPYFDSFGVEHIPKEIKKFIGSRNITANTFRIQSYYSRCGYFCIGFIDFMLNSKSFN